MLNILNKRPKEAANSLLFISLVFKIILEYSKCTSLLTKLGDYCARSTDSLLDGALLIKLGKTAHSTEILSSINHDDGNLTLCAESTDELLVLIILAILCKTAETSRTAVKGLCTLMKSLLETIMDEGLLKNLWHKD